MRLRLILSVFIGVFLFSACHKDEVNTAYLLDVDQLTIMNGNGSDPEGWKQIFLDSLARKEYIGVIEFSGESRAENDKLAKEKFEGKYESILVLDLKTIFDLGPAETVLVKFNYILTRGKEELRKEECALSLTTAPAK